MKRVLIFLGFLLAFISCSKKVIPTAETSFLTTKDGVLNLRSTGYCQLKDFKDQCVNEAEQNAFKTLFYRGIPGSPQPTPLIGINETEKTASEKFMQDFFTSGRYKTFIVSSIPVSDIVKLRNQKRVTVDVGINLTSLRKELEHKKVIPQFGY